MHSLKDTLRITGLLNSLKNQKPGVRRQAVKALGEENLEAPLALRHFGRSMEDEDTIVRVSAVKAMEKIGAAAVPRLAEALASPCRRVRREAAWALGRLGPAAEPAVVPLMTALRDRDPKVAQAAAHTLGLIGPKASGAAEALVVVLADSNYLLCRMAAWALAQIGAAAVPALIQALTSPDMFVRCEAAWALAQIGRAASDAVPALVTVLRSDEAQCLAKAMTSLPAEAEHLCQTTPVFIPPRKGTAEAFCLSAIKALGEIGPPAAEAVPDLRRLAEAGNGTAQIVAIQALRQIDPAAASGAA
jgi:HEAT repeat protein